ARPGPRSGGRRRRARRHGGALRPAPRRPLPPGPRDRRSLGPGGGGPGGLFDHARTHYESLSFRVRTRQRPEATGLRGPPGPAAFWTRLRGTREQQVNLKREGTEGRARPGLDRARARERDRDELGDAPRPRGQDDDPIGEKD